MSNKITRRDVLRLAAAGAGALTLAGCGQAGHSPTTSTQSNASRNMKRPPNLLFLITDEQRADTLACYGNKQIEMPNLNRLAERATVVERAYVTQPVCTPSRSSLMTGQYPHTNGCIGNYIALRPDTRCLPEYLPRGVYKTAYHGKWHLGDEIYPQHGFDEWKGIEDGYAKHNNSPGRNNDDRSSYHHWLVSKGYKPDEKNFFSRVAAAKLPEEHSKPAFLAETATEFLHRNREHPWCLFVSFLEPHMPFTGPRDRQYDPAKMPLPASLATPPKDHHLRARIYSEIFRRRGSEGLDLSGEPGWRTLMARYWGLCSQVDTYAGRILKTVEELGLWDNTIIVFTSDHGDIIGAHQCLTKTLMYEESVRIPLLVKLAGQRAGSRMPGLVSQIDLLPTLLEAMGQPAPAGLDGQSILTSMSTGAAGRAESDVFIEWNPSSNSTGGLFKENDLPDFLLELAPRERLLAALRDTIRTIQTSDGWKFNCSAAGMHELFNLKADPNELTNLAATPSGKAKMRELLPRIRAWQKRTGDKVPLPEIG